MAKDFFQDITPKDDKEPRREKIQGDEVEVPSDTEAESPVPEVPERSIRNISVSRPRPMDKFVSPPKSAADRREVPPVGGGLPRKKFRLGASIWLWAVVAVLIVLIAVLLTFVFRSTSVTVTPRSQSVVFDATKSITAYPSSSDTSGALTYTVHTFDLDDSQTVTSSGSAQVQRKASGSVTLVNEFSAAPVKLVKTTRFQTPDGLVFRAPADVSIPGMKGATPGSITVTLVADQAGANYNIGPVSRFTLPGLKGGNMYEKVYARSTGNFSGGFSGTEPSVDAATKNAAVAEMQGRLQGKIAVQLASYTDGTIIPDLAMISYEELAATSAEAGKATLNLRANVKVPVLPTEAFNRSIASSVSADAENSRIQLQPQGSLSAILSNASTTSYGSTPISFAMKGNARLIWEVDSKALAQALAGKNDAAFQTVVNGFTGIQEARAHIEPFWRHSFPSDPNSIEVVVNKPAETATQ